MKSSRKKNKKLPMSLTKRIVLCVLAVVVICVLIYLAYYIIHYMCYKGYEKYLTSYEYEQGTEIVLKDTGYTEVPGMSFVCENDKLMLFTDTETAIVAIYDKRDGSITYTNPLNADEDENANKSNKNLLKSQMVVYYYNSAVTSGSLDSYSKCVQKNQFTYEGLSNGLRYIYRIGDITDNNGAEGISFEIPLEYRLEDDGLVVSIPTGAIKEYGNASVYRIQLLRFMGAASTEEDGYIVVPNASGSLINFNNGKTSVAQYSQYIYDLDPMASNYTTLENVDSAMLPIFGICRKDRSLLVSIEEGATLSVITAGVSGMFNSYNYVYPTFVLRNIDNLRMFGNSTTDVYVLEEDIYDLNIKVKYSFLNSDQTGYSGIANYYRNRLVSEGVLEKMSTGGDIPLYYDIISGVKETGHFLGIQYMHVFSMTDFDEAKEIAVDLSKAGISNQVMNLQGWFNGGYYHNAADTINVIDKLGGKSGLEALNEAMSELGGILYADVAFQKVTFADNGFNYNAEGSRYYGAGYVASFGLVNPAILRNTSGLMYSENLYDLLSPKFLPRYVEKFAKKIQRYDVSGISLRDLGNYLFSDIRRTNVIDREEALNIVLGQFDVLEGTGKNLMTNAANAYCLAYSDDIINVPLDQNEFFIVDESIPLYQMIIHGSISYSGTLLNYEDCYNRNETILELIETGTNPHYQLTWESASLMKETGINRFYTTTYTTWKDDMIETYNQVNAALKYVNGAFVTEHQILDNGVRKVSYDNGVVIYINYQNSVQTADGYEIPAASYRLEGIR